MPTGGNEKSVLARWRNERLKVKYINDTGGGQEPSIKTGLIVWRRSH